MALSRKDEEFVVSLFDGIETSIRSYSDGDTDREWAITSRIGDILAEQANGRLARIFGFTDLIPCDTPVEVYLHGEVVYRSEAGLLQNELWIGLKESIQSVIDDRNVRSQVMRLDGGRG